MHDGDNNAVDQGIWQVMSTAMQAITGGYLPVIVPIVQDGREVLYIDAVVVKGDPRQLDEFNMSAMAIDATGIVRDEAAACEGVRLRD